MLVDRHLKPLILQVFPPYFFLATYLLKKLVVHPVEFGIVWIPLTASSWYQLTCSFVSCIPCKLAVESRGSTRLKFVFGKTTSHMVIRLLSGTSVFVILVATGGHCLEPLVHYGLRNGPAPVNPGLDQ